MKASWEFSKGKDWFESLVIDSSGSRRLLWTSVVALTGYLTVKYLTGSKRKSTPSGFNNFLINDSKPARQPSKSRPQPSVAANSFDAFLLESKPALPSTDFNSFLKVTETSLSASQNSNSDSETLAATGPREDQAVVTVLFGTEYGFAKEIAERLCSMITEGTDIWPRLVDMADHPDGMDLSQEQALLVVCSTQGDGVPPSEARGFCDWLSSSKAPELTGTSYSVCALGDTSYEHFCACGKQLDATLAGLKARCLAARQEVNREDWKAVNSWLSLVLEQLPSLKLKSVQESGYVLPEGQLGGGIGRRRPFMGTVVAAEGLCQVGSGEDKDTIRVEIDLGDSALEYLPGDALGIYATNAPEVVSDLMEHFGAHPGEQHLLPTWHYADAARPAASSISLEDMLTYCYDLRSPKADLLQLLVDCMPEPEETPANGFLCNGHSEHISDHQPTANGNGNANGNGKASHLIQGKLDTEMQPKAHHQESVTEQVKQLRALLESSEDAIEQYFEPRHVIDVLMDFPSSQPSLTKVLASLRPLQPRLYSISSSPLENSHTVQVTVAVVKYKSLGKERLGVASTYLAHRIKVGEQLPVYISRNPDFRLPADPGTPIIMVGPGTGLAPFRAFAMERVLSGAAFGECLLYFGCRRRDQDFLYGSLLESWAAQGHIQLSTAFSRQQAHKVYVQDRLRETGGRVWELLEAGAHFYVCGDAAHMASAVEAALLDIITDHQGQNAAAAAQYLESLKVQERYQRDVWF